MSMMRWRPVAFGLIAGLSLNVWSAERLDYRVPTGLAYTFENVTDSTADLRMAFGGQSMPVQQRVVQTVSGRVEVLSVDDGVPTHLRISFDANSGTRSTVNGGQQVLPFALAGQAVEVRVSGERVTSIVGADGRTVALDDASREFVGDVAVLERAMLPRVAVEVGDDWRADLSREDRSLNPEVDMTLTGFETRSGRRTATIDAKATLVGNAGGLDMSGTVSGPIALDMETGLPVSSRLTGTMRVEGVMQQEGGVVTVSGSQAMVVASRSEIVAGAATAPAGWREFNHSSGATFSHPQDWRAQEYANGVGIQPADGRGDELIVASGAPANGTTDPAAPEVGTYLDGLMSQTIPGAQRTGPPVAVDAAKGPGALYRYTGTLPDGRAVACEVYVTIEGGTALTLSAVAAPEVLRGRGATLRRIFGTLALGRATGPAVPATRGGTTSIGDDPRLVGMFAGEALAGGGDAGVYVNTQLVSVLNADGTAYYGARSHFSASQRDTDGNLKWSATGNTGQDVQRGRWSASNGMLTIRWDQGGTSVYAYGFEPDGTLVLRHPQTRKLINFYSRVR